MPPILTHSTFSNLLQTTFKLLCAPEQAVEVELIEAKELPSRMELGGRRPFSLLFRAPREFHEVQRIFRLEHGELGELDIFLVPIGPDTKGMLMEAIFN